MLARTAECSVPFVQCDADIAAWHDLADHVSDVSVEALVRKGAGHEGGITGQITILRPVMMNREQIDFAADLHQSRSVLVRILVSDGNDLDRLIHSLHHPAVALRNHCVSGATRVSPHPVSPDLVADLPIDRAKGLWMHSSPFTYSTQLAWGRTLLAMLALVHGEAGLSAVRVFLMTMQHMQMVIDLTSVTI